jgi:flavodoxin short chain
MVVDPKGGRGEAEGGVKKKGAKSKSVFRIFAFRSGIAGTTLSKGDFTMSKVIIVYWSGTGNTEKVAELIEKGAAGKGASVVRKTVGEASVDELSGYDVIAFGSPSMGVETIEEAEMEPFFTDAAPKLGGKKVAIFGSYGWGDGEWLRTWADRVRETGARLIGDGLAVHETPDDASSAECIAYGEKIASA